MKDTLPGGYGVLPVVLILLAALLLGGCQGSPATDPHGPEALRKAHALQEKLRGRGLPVPDADVLVELYGTNGGVAGIYSDSEFQTYYNLIHFGNTGRRPVYLDPGVVSYDEAVLEVYAPGNLPAYRELVEEWQTKKTI
ncbi:MAG: hypothetical protein KKF41_05625 [Actinobacteria bacterium]|nr:hypothetical protein [Actinomycetota bacterium]MBU1942477.1 hypothetical protein [Actinomycetota bacterium]MBU2687046.1 hypothetical protein [Actinomycetota bacterium]